METLKMVRKWKSAGDLSETKGFAITFLWLMFFCRKNSVVCGKVLVL